MVEHPPFIQVARGDAPLLVTFPHTGTDLPDAPGPRPDPAHALTDTDWHIHRLYEFVTALGATTLRTTVSRSIIDVGRDPSGASLYPGQTTTGLVPLETFAGVPLYGPGEAPDDASIADRRERFHRPFHAALWSEVERLRTRHDAVVIYDCHSIASELPRLFPGTLPVFNIGTDGGRTCDPRVTRALVDALWPSGQSLVVDGRFRGGWITRAYGRPAEGVHTIQLELAQRAYMVEGAPDQPAPQAWDASRGWLQAAMCAVRVVADTLARGRHG